MRTRFVAAVRGNRLTGITLLFIIAVALTGMSATGYAQGDSESSQNLAGAWNVKIEFDTPGVEGCIAPSMNTRDGGVMAGACSLAESPGYGQWVRTANRQFGITFVGQGFDLATGAISYTYKVRASVRLTQDLRQFSGPFFTDIFAPDGTLVFTASGLVTADRVNVEPLP